MNTDTKNILDDKKEKRTKVLMDSQETLEKAFTDGGNALSDFCEKPVEIKSTPFWYNLMKSLKYKPAYNDMQLRFQKLAGIVREDVLVVLTLPNDNKIEFKDIPPWYDIIRYKLCGFKCKIL